MFAMRMAWRMGRPDVDQMLDELTPEQFTEWVAADRLGLDDIGWRQAGTIASTIHNELALIRSIVTQRPMRTNDCHGPDKYIPHAEQKKKQGGIRKHQHAVARRHAYQKDR